MCQGVSHFSSFLYHFVMAKLATSNIRVKGLTRDQQYGHRVFLQPTLETYTMEYPVKNIILLRLYSQSRISGYEKQEDSIAKFSF